MGVAVAEENGGTGLDYLVSNNKNKRSSVCLSNPSVAVLYSQANASNALPRFAVCSSVTYDGMVQDSTV